jgi:phage shock protein A
VATAKGPAKNGKDALAKLADRGEEALQRLADLPGGTKALGAFNDLRARVDEVAKKARGIDKLEARVEKLERELAALKRASAKPKPAPRKPAA